MARVSPPYGLDCAAANEQYFYRDWRGVLFWADGEIVADILGVADRRVYRHLAVYRTLGR